MIKFKPFHCINFYLDQKKSWDEPFTEEAGYYVVVWWTTIPIGEFYIRAGEILNVHHFEQRLVHAVRPVLQFYGHNDAWRGETIEDCIQWCRSIFPPEQPVPSRCEATVIICTKDRAESLLKCLQSLHQLQCRPTEIIVVDNATRDESTKDVCALFPDIIYVREDRPGLDFARNTGARKASGQIVIYTDDDTIPDPLWVYHTCQTFLDETVSAMTGLVLAHELKTEAQWIFEKFWPFNRGYIDKRFDEKFFSATLSAGPPVWNIGAGANMAFRKSVFESSGYFDERLDVGAAGCNGDSEMWYRILASGAVIHYNPRAIVSHVHRESMDKLQSQIFYYMRGFTAAILIQYQRYRHKGNLKHLFLELPKYYGYLLLRGFPKYRGRFTTIFSEMGGLFSGLIFYLKNRNT